MAHIHDHGTTVVEDSSSSSVLVAVLVIALLALAIWFVGFSGIVMNRDEGTNTVERTEIREKSDSDTTIIQPGTDTGTQQPAQSPAP